jgi:cell division protein ZipA
MQANWSLLLNILLLIVIIVAISRMMKARRQDNKAVNTSPSLGQGHSESSNYDDIIAVRKINREKVEEETVLKPSLSPSFQPKIHVFEEPSSPPVQESKPAIEEVAPKKSQSTSLMVFLLAKENRQLAGYELLQTILAAGLRFGEGHLFHRHQFPNGQGPVLCSLAAATPSGIFDLQNIGAFSVRGLCLFMQSSGNSIIDKDRLQVLLETAKQLSEGLDTILLDQKRQPLTEERVRDYYRQLNIELN